MSAVESLARRAKEASVRMRSVKAEQKTAAIRAMAKRLRARKAELIAANAGDLDRAGASGLGAAKLERLTLNDKRVEEMAAGLEVVASLPDPVGRVIDERTGPSGIRCRRVRIPIGVILMIFESRPNVTAEAAALCLRSSNACLLRGGREAAGSNAATGRCLQEALAEAGLPADAVQMVGGGHDVVDELLKQERYIDVVIPRGGEGLIRSVAEKSRIPVIKHYMGNCHVYIDEAADPKMADEIVFNSKVQRPATCNAAEKLLVHEKVAASVLPPVLKRLAEAGVELRGGGAARAIVPEMKPAVEKDWHEEYLDKVMAVKVVKDLDEAIGHINRYGSGHTDAIVTGNEAAARRFLEEVDSSSVMWNCSTRFADGGQYGLGAEIGISTDRLHARGPMGADELTCYKWVVEGAGQVRT